MFLNTFAQPNVGKWILPSTGLVWLLGGYFLLKDLGLTSEIAFVDAFFFAILFLSGVLLLDRVFRHYSPNVRNAWLLVGIPLVFSGGSVWLHLELLSWWFSEESSYLSFLDRSFSLRWLPIGIAELLLALLVWLSSRLAGQEELSRREAKLLELSKEAELAQLRQQLQPHFLFNSLNSVNALVMTQPQKARDMILLLSDFLRGTLRSDSQSWISLADELKYLSMYFAIEQVRFGHRLSVELSFEKETEQLKVPPLLIQPLVENAVKYGLYGTVDAVRIAINCTLSGNFLQVDVTNPYDPEGLDSSGTGFGLSSVTRRLYLLFGRKDLLQVRAAGGLFHVQLKIPLPS